MQKLSLHGKTSKFIDLVGQLRFQKRWSQSPRVPETSVMGHVLIVAVLAYVCSLRTGADATAWSAISFAGFSTICPKC